MINWFTAILKTINLYHTLIYMHNIKFVLCMYTYMDCSYMWQQSQVENEYYSVLSDLIQLALLQ